jgi:hypothetical protein
MLLAFLYVTLRFSAYILSSYASQIVPICTGSPRGDGNPKLALNLLSEEDFQHLPLILFLLFSGI